jgi:hypothetical protein
MALKADVRKDDERGVYVYYVVHDGAEIPFLERKFGNVDKRIARAAEQAKAEPQPDESAQQ